mgnify:CR=1 FL=1
MFSSVPISHLHLLSDSFADSLPHLLYIYIHNYMNTCVHQTLHYGKVLTN